MLSVEELRYLVSIVCNPQSEKEVRASAEHRFKSFQNDENAWLVHIELISSVDDSTLLFFLFISLKFIIWKRWKYFTPNVKQEIGTFLVNFLLNKSGNLMSFVISKLEQVIAAICINSVSLDLVMQMMVPYDNPNIIITISLLQTVLDEIFQEDSRISLDDRLALTTVAKEMASSMTSLACNVCLTCLHTSSQDNYNLTRSLELLKTIVGKIEVGDHISNDLIDLLFSISERGASISSNYSRSAVLAVEVLTELMCKRYLPTGNVPNTVNTSKDIGANILVDLVARAVTMLGKYRSMGSSFLAECQIVIPLIEFITSFSEFHLERCLLAQSTGMAANICAFLAELSQLTCACNEVPYMAKIATMWEKLVDIDAVKETLATASSSDGETIWVPAAKHLLQCCLTNSNEKLLDLAEELEDDIQLDPVGDAHIRELISHINNDSITKTSKESTGQMVESSLMNELSSAQNVLETEEYSCQGSAMRQAAVTTLVEFCQCLSVRSCLVNMLSQLLQQTLNIVLNPISGSNDTCGSRLSGALDAIFLIQLCPSCLVPDELAPFMCSFLQQLIESRIYSSGKASVALVLACALSSKNLLQHCFFGPINSAMPSMLNCMPIVTRLTLASCDGMIAPTPTIIMLSCICLFLQTLTFVTTRNDWETNAADSTLIMVREDIQKSLLPRIDQLPLDVQAIALCAVEIVIPDVAASITNQFISHAHEVCSSGLSDSAMTILVTLSNTSLVMSINRLSASMNAIGKHHSMSKPARRQAFIASILPIADCLHPLVETYLRALMFSITIGQTESPAGIHLPSSSSIISSLKYILSLVTGLLQSLGKKSFGKVALLCLQSCAIIVHEREQSPVKQLLMSSILGISFVRQILDLTRVVAVSSSSIISTADEQIEVSRIILSYVCQHLSDPIICSELLHDTLKVGVNVVSCYWKHETNINSESGITVKSIAILLTQLYCGSLGDTVPPQDAQTAIDGMLQLSQHHNVFSTAWFRDKSLNGSSCWDQILIITLRALLINSHPTLRDSLLSLFECVISSVSPQMSSNSNQSMSSMDFWNHCSNEAYQIATEFGCQDIAGNILMHFMQRIQNERINVDSIMFYRCVIGPISAEIVKAKL